MKLCTFWLLQRLINVENAQQPLMGVANVLRNRNAQNARQVIIYKTEFAFVPKDSILLQPQINARIVVLLTL